MTSDEPDSRSRGLRRRARRRRRLAVAVTDALGRGIPDAGLGRWLARAAPRRATGAVTVALVSDRRIRALNRRYRGRDAVTDVLSFPADVPSTRHEPPPRRRLSRRPPRPLGDIVIGRERARRQAAAQGHSVGTELRILALHGLLHLLGYDHERDGGQMARLERRLRVRSGLPAGLTERADASQS